MKDGLFNYLFIYLKFSIVQAKRISVKKTKWNEAVQY